MKKSFQTLFIILGLILFFGFIYLLFTHTDKLTLLFPLYSAVILYFVVFVGLEAATLFTVLGTFIGIVNISAGKFEAAPFIIAEMVALWLVWWIARLILDREEKEANQTRQMLEQAEEILQQSQQGNHRYEEQYQQVGEKIERYHHLSLAARELGSSLDAEEIRRRLLGLMRKFFSQGVVYLKPFTQARDIFDNWVAERNVPLLVYDLKKDLRFDLTLFPNPVSALMAAPIVVEKKTVAILRNEGFKPNIYDQDDLRLLDMLALFTSLALENAQLFSHVQQLAIRDSLTGLYTNRFFQERLAEEILRAARFNTNLGLIIVDIDHFKQVNDTYGHQSGDEVLVRVARLLKEQIRISDIAARLGGEEFALLLPVIEKKEAVNIAEKIRRKMEEKPFDFSGGRQKQITLSAGVAVFPQDATAASQLIRQADTHLYSAKHNGRNQVVYSK